MTDLTNRLRISARMAKDDGRYADAEYFDIAADHIEELERLNDRAVVEMARMQGRIEELEQERIEHMATIAEHEARIRQQKHEIVLLENRLSYMEKHGWSV